MTNNSRESIDENDDDSQQIRNTQGHIAAGPVTSSRNEKSYRLNQHLNTSEFMHSRLGLLDNHITINYDLSVPMIKATEVVGESKPKKLKRKEKFAKANNYKEMS